MSLPCGAIAAIDDRAFERSESDKLSLRSSVTRDWLATWTIPASYDPRSKNTVRLELLLFGELDRDGVAPPTCLIFTNGTSEAEDI